MNRNFELGQSNEILQSGRVYDLHNDYLPSAVVLDLQVGALKISFSRISQNHSVNHCALVFHEVDSLEISGNVCAASGLDEMGYKGTDDYDYEWLSGESQSVTGDHFVIRFDGGATLRVHGVSAEFIEDRT